MRQYIFVGRYTSSYLILSEPSWIDATTRYRADEYGSDGVSACCYLRVVHRTETYQVVRHSPSSLLYWDNIALERRKECIEGAYNGVCEDQCQVRTE